MAELTEGQQYWLRDAPTGRRQDVTARIAHHEYPCKNCGQKIAEGELHGAYGFSHYCAKCVVKDAC